MAKDDVARALMVMAQLKGFDATSDVAELYMADLAPYPDHVVLEALARCRRELKHFPQISEIIERIDDGRPGPEEAWAMIPTDERESIVWTDEMRDAYAVARPLVLRGDLIGARLAFKEKYVKLLAEVRNKHRPVRWSVSFGTNRLGQLEAVNRAIGEGRLRSADAQRLLPEYPQEASGLLSLPPPVQERPPTKAEVESRELALTDFKSVMDRIYKQLPSSSKARVARETSKSPEAIIDQKEAERRAMEQLDKFERFLGDE